MAERLGDRRARPATASRRTRSPTACSADRDSVLPHHGPRGVAARAPPATTRSLARLASRRSDELQFLGAAGRGEGRAAAGAGGGDDLPQSRALRLRVRRARHAGAPGERPPDRRRLLRARRGALRLAGPGEGGQIARQNRAWCWPPPGDLHAAREAASPRCSRRPERLDRLEDESPSGSSSPASRCGRATGPRRARQLDRGGPDGRAHGQRPHEAGQTSPTIAPALALGQRQPRGGRAAASPDSWRASRPSTTCTATSPRFGWPRSHARRRAISRGGAARSRRPAVSWRTGAPPWATTSCARYAFAATALGEHDPQAPAARVLAALAGGGRVDAAFALAEQRRARLLDRPAQPGRRAPRRGAARVGPAHRVRPLEAAEIVRGAARQRDRDLEYVAGSEGAPTTLFVVTRARAPGAGAAERRTRSRPSSAGSSRCWRPAARPDALARTLGATLLAAGRGPPARRRDPAGHRSRRAAPPGAVRRAPARRRPRRGRSAGRSASRPPPASRPRSGASAVPVEVAVASRTQHPRARRSRVRARGGVRRLRGEAEVFRSAFAAQGGLPRLAGSGEEARAVARYAARRLRGSAARRGERGWLKHAPLDRVPRHPPGDPRAGGRELAGADRARARARRATRTASSPRRIWPASSSTRTWSCCRPAAPRAA